MSVIMGNKNIVVRSDIKQLSLRRNPTKLVFAALSKFVEVQLIKERGKKIHFSIMSCFEKVNIPLTRVARKHQMVNDRSILTTSQIEQVWKKDHEGLIPAPHIMPEFNFRAIIDLKSSV